MIKFYDAVNYPGTVLVMWLDYDSDTRGYLKVTSS